MNKEINVFKNGKYIYTTDRFKTCKEAVENCKSKKIIEVASIPNYMVVIEENDKITARFKKEKREW